MSSLTKAEKKLARKKRLERLLTAWGETYTKRITTFIILNAIAWVWCSYILAWCGRYEIAQSLSQTALTAILGVVITNGVKSTTENVSKNGYVGKIRRKKFSDVEETAQDTIQETIQEIKED